MALAVLALERVPPGLKGDLSRWMLQPTAGVFVADLSREVRERLWNRVCEYRDAGACVMVTHASNEQGFELRQRGDRARELVDLDGFAAVRTSVRSRGGVGDGVSE
ncbi:MAG: type I-E CRISPR-associated endoribonuclease Cas2e [Patulibacter sp.]